MVAVMRSTIKEVRDVKKDRLHSSLPLWPDSLFVSGGTDHHRKTVQLLDLRPKGGANVVRLLPRQGFSTTPEHG